MADIFSIPVEPDKLFSGLSELTDGERGTYLTLLTLMWRNGKPLRDDDPWLARMCNVSTRKFRIQKLVLIEANKIKVENKTVINEKALNSYKGALERHLANVEKATKAADKRWEKRPKTPETSQSDDACSSATKNTESNANQRQRHSQVVDSKSPILNTESLFDTFELDIDSCATDAAPRNWKLMKFNEFWDAFDHKSGKAQALKSWNSIKGLNPELADEIITGAKNYTRFVRPEINKKNGSPKMAQGWLSDRRWEDEVTPSKTETDTRAQYAKGFQG